MIKITVRVDAQTETHTQSQEESPNWVVNANEKIFTARIKGIHV